MLIITVAKNEDERKINTSQPQPNVEFQVSNYEKWNAFRYKVHMDDCMKYIYIEAANIWNVRKNRKIIIFDKKKMTINSFW